MATTAPRLRIMCAIDSLAGGGAERTLATLAGGLDSDAFEVSLVTTLGMDVQQTLAAHVPLHQLAAGLTPGLLAQQHGRLARWGDGLLSALLALRVTETDGRRALFDAARRDFVRGLRLAALCTGRHILATRPDCVLGFLPLTNLVVLLAQRWYRLRVPVILSDRNFLTRELNSLPFPRLLRHAINAYYPAAAHHVAVSRAAAADLAQHYGIAPAAITTIYNGVDAARLRGAAAAPCADDRAATGIRLVAVGRLHRQKGFDLLLDALALLRDQDWTLRLLGSGPEEAALRARAAGHGIAGRVVFGGYDANPWRWMARADLFVLSSRWEGLPNVMLEAMTLGLPVIASDCPSGPAEILADGRYGELVANESPAALAAALRTAIGDASWRARLAALACERAAEFRQDAMIDRYATLLRTVASPLERESTT